jgi:hypothetical protein
MLHKQLPSGSAQTPHKLKQKFDPFIKAFHVVQSRPSKKVRNAFCVKIIYFVTNSPHMSKLPVQYDGTY